MTTISQYTSVSKPVLRDYQQDLENRVREAFAAGAKRVLVVCPTGGGKTVIFSSIVCGAREKRSQTLSVVHRIEIVRQIVASFGKFGIYPGVIAPGHTMTRESALVGMIQTVARRLDKMVAPRLIVIDEAHHAVSATYLKMLSYWPGAKVIGVTASPVRLDGRGLGSVFDTMIVGPTTRWLIENGYLARYKYYAPKEEIDLSGVRTTAGDYNTLDLQVAVDTKRITGSAVEHYREYLGGRPAIAFCVNVAHCHHVAAEFRLNGWAAEVIDGTMKPDDRSALVARLAAGSLNVLVSCDVVSEGFDVPIVSGAILLRPTKSLAMCLQQWGRALRVKPDGSDAIFLDHVGNARIHGLPDDEREWSLEDVKRKSTPPKSCGKCFRVFAATASRDEIIRECPRLAEGVGDPVDVCGLLERRVRSGPVDGAMPEVVEGKLAEMVRDPNAIDLRGGSLARLTEWAAEDEGNFVQLRERLAAIRAARGYKSGWVKRAFDGTLVAWADRQEQRRIFSERTGDV